MGYSAIELLILALAVYRASDLLIYDDIFAWPRNWVHARLLNFKPQSFGMWMLAGVQCASCVGVWLALFGYLLRDFKGAQFVIIWLAIAGLANVIRRFEK